MSMEQFASFELAPLTVRLQRINNTADKLCQLAQRWDNSLILEGLPLTEHYINGRIAIALVMQVGFRAWAWLAGDADNGPVFCCDPEQHIDGPGRADRRVFLLILSDRDDRAVMPDNGRDEHAVLIHFVKLIEREESRIAPILVRLYDISDY